MVKALCKLQDMKQSLTVFEQYQGIYLLLVHPNEQVIQSKSHVMLRRLHRREVPFGNHVLAPPFLSRCAAGQSIQQRP